MIFRRMQCLICFVPLLKMLQIFEITSAHNISFSCDLYRSFVICAHIPEELVWCCSVHLLNITAQNIWSAGSHCLLFYFGCMCWLEPLCPTIHIFYQDRLAEDSSTFNYKGFEKWHVVLYVCFLYALTKLLVHFSLLHSALLVYSGIVDASLLISVVSI